MANKDKPKVKTTKVLSPMLAAGHWTRGGNEGNSVKHFCTMVSANQLPRATSKMPIRVNFAFTVGSPTS